MATLHIYLFGTPRVELDGVALHMERRKVMALLAYLAVATQSHSRDALATLLWPDYGQSEARAHLRRALSNLTKIIGKEWLEISRQQLGMADAPDLWIDVVEFEEAMYAAEEAADAQEQLTLLERAADLYTDDFLHGFSLSDSADFDDWQTIQAAQLRQQLLTILQALVQGHSATGSAGYDAAVRYAQRWLALDPLYEVAHRYLMQLYTWRGDRVAALGQYQECVRLLREELGVEPEEATQDLYEQIRAGDISSEGASALSLATPAVNSGPDLLPAPGAQPASTAPATPQLPPHNLPAQLTTFCGRAEELAQLQSALSDGVRLVTLVGEGGVGKSRLAAAAAHKLLAHFEQQIWFVALSDFDAGLGDQADSKSDRNSQNRLASMILEVLGPPTGPSAQEEAQSVQDQLMDALPPTPMLLLLDGFERAFPAADLVFDLLQRAPGLTIWITSSEPLGFRAEHVMRITGLPVADGPTSDATLQLFADRAQQHTDSFTVDAANRDDIVQICQLVAGSPLGIELAAVWTEYFTCAEIAKALHQQDLDLLSVSFRDIPERHRSLRNIFSYAWSLLDAPQQQTLAQLSVFRGTIERSAAGAVTGCSMQDLIALFQKSLLYQVSPGRFEMPKLLRAFAHEKLAQVEDGAETVDRHMTYFLAFVHSREKELQSRNAEGAVQEIAVNIKNVRAAWHRAVEEAQWQPLCDAAPGMVRYYQHKGLYYESMDVLGYAAQQVRRLRQEATSTAQRSALSEAEQLLNRLVNLSFRRRRRTIPDI